MANVVLSTSSFNPLPPPISSPWYTLPLKHMLISLFDASSPARGDSIAGEPVNEQLNEFQARFLLSGLICQAITFVEGVPRSGILVTTLRREN